MGRSVEQAFKQIDRADFLPPEAKAAADLDRPVSIGYGQTNSQPSTVHRMLKWLDVKRNQKVLDVGSGSGWTTALLSHLVGNKGEVYAVERIPELLKFGRENCRRIGITNAQFLPPDTIYGLPKYEPYDRILVSASADKLPDELIDQLHNGGKMVIPVVNTVLEITKKSDDDYNVIEHPGFVFVPLV